MSLLLLDGEAFSAAAFFGGIGIIEMESRSQALRNEIDLGTVEEAQAVVRHDDFHSIIFEHNIVGADTFGHLDHVSPTGATGFPYAQAEADATVLDQKTTYPFRCRFA